jgi:thiamine biosynthesis lipoprotein
MSLTRPERVVRAKADGNSIAGRFFAMGSPCELLVDTRRLEDGKQLTQLVAAEAWRIEDKLSRYIDGNTIDRVNRAAGRPIELDEETAHLIDFAETLHDLSEGGFDITSGALRRVWNFDGSDNLPTASDVANAVKQVGWQHVDWQYPVIRLQVGMEIDLGGIGKEYAVDRCAEKFKDATTHAGLINFGGDLIATRPPLDRNGWAVGIESIDQSGRAGERLVNLQVGALATSGDARRYLLRDGVRYSHILDPTTGWPVPDAPRSVTVAADSCTQAGMLSTLAMLKGIHAEAFLEEQGIQYWCLR